MTGQKAQKRQVFSSPLFLSSPSTLFSTLRVFRFPFSPPVCLSLLKQKPASCLVDQLHPPPLALFPFILSFGLSLCRPRLALPRPLSTFCCSSFPHLHLQPTHLHTFVRSHLFSNIYLRLAPGNLQQTSVYCLLFHIFYLFYFSFYFSFLFPLFLHSFHITL